MMKTTNSAILLLVIINIYSVLSINGETKNETNPPINYRLDRTILPSHYQLSLKPYLLENEVANKKQFTFDGTVEITLAPTKTTKEIVLHAKNLDFGGKKPTLKPVSSPVTEIEVTDIKPDSQNDKLTINLATEIVKDKEYVLTFNDYVGQMDDDMHGFYRSNYTRKNGKTVYIGSTQFEPVHARRVFPCFDEPQFKATFQVRINHNNVYSAVSNTPILTFDDKIESGRNITTFEITPKMSTYLLAFLVSDFIVNGDENELAVIAREDARDQTEYALDVGKKLLTKLNEFTGIPYKSLGNPKMHLAAIPDFSAGAMENWGLLTFRERALLYDAKSTTAAAQESIAAVIAHEQAHMWFGDYVTCAWWNVTWLNEGFARYFQYFITHEVNPEWELDKQFVVKQIQSVFVMDSLNNTHPMTNKDTNSPVDIGKMFDNISYNKGASIIRMIEHMLGKENFKKALRDYFKDKNIILGNALPQDLFRAFKKYWTNTAVSLDTIRLDWTEQVGYPVVKVELNGDRKSFNISQQRFVLKKGIQNSNLTYTIPFTYVTNKQLDFNNTQPDLFLSKDKKVETVQLNEEVDWVIGNKLQTGYYRVNYDDKTWDQIHHALQNKNFSQIHELNRAQIVDDLFNFGRAGIMSYDRVLHLVDYLKKENNYLPWYAALNGLNHIATRLGQSEQKLIGKYILSLIENIYNELKLYETAVEQRLVTHNRAQILEWACKYGHDDCIKNSKLLFDKLMKDNVQVPVNIRSVVYCTALREGNVTDFDFLWNKYKNEVVATEQVLILGILGCAKSKDVVENYLNYILSPDVRRQDKSSAFSSTYTNNQENVQIVFDFLTSHVDDFKKAFGNYSDVATLISNLASRFTTEDQKKQLQKFYDEKKGDFGDAAKTLETAIKNVDENLHWSKENLPKVLDYLRSNYNGAMTTSVSFILIAFTTLLIVLFNNH